MQKILLAPLFVLVACGGSGHASLQWSITYPDGTATTCLTGETVVLAVGSHQTTFDCNAGLTGPVLSNAIPWGTYDSVTASLVYTDPTTGAVTVEDQYTFTAGVEIDVGDTTDLPAVVFQVAEPVPTTGAVSFTWSLQDPDNGGPAPRNCDASESIQVTLSGLSPFTIACGTAAQPYTESNLPPGTYTGTYSLLTNGQVESGPGEVPGSFMSDDSAPDTYTDGNPVTVTVGDTSSVSIVFYVDRSSF